MHAGAISNRHCLTLMISEYGADRVTEVISLFAVAQGFGGEVASRELLIAAVTIRCSGTRPGREIRKGRRLHYAV